MSFGLIDSVEDTLIVGPDHDLLIRVRPQVVFNCVFDRVKFLHMDSPGPLGEIPRVLESLCGGCVTITPVPRCVCDYLVARRLFG